MRTDRVEDVLALPADQATTLLLALPESQWFDRKSGRIEARGLAKILVAMGNAEGGSVAVGFHGGRVEPMVESKMNDIRQAAADHTAPIVSTVFHEIPVEGGSVALIEVGPGGGVHETRSGEAYLRIGDETRRLTFTQRRELEYDRGAEVFSATVLRQSSLDDLDPKAAQAYQRAIGASSVESMLAARDLIDRDGRLRVAAWLLFARRPGHGFPNAHVRVIQYGASERGTGRALSVIAGHDVRCEGVIGAQLEKAIALIDQWLPQRHALGRSGRFEDLPMIPRDAWLEGLVNAVIHRSYSNQGDHIRFEIFPNRVEVTSPGRFPSFGDPNDPESIIRYARNPRIARASAELGYAHELGEGIRRMFEWMREHGLTPPVYAQTSEHVVLTLSATPAHGASGLPKTAAIILERVRQAGLPLKTGEVAELAGVARTTAIRHLNALRAADLVTWRGDSPRDPHATWTVA
ncbi:MAG: putative DNA binding domain-containing protein [Propionibacteriaceae bacterium]|jgi:ATP-dependent DNA helicase RecG|nr:putative DNA binding domain-containing protein [Propionibacteriaceae bacterium]